MGRLVEITHQGPLIITVMTDGAGGPNIVESSKGYAKRLDDYFDAQALKEYYAMSESGQVTRCGHE